MEIALYIVAGIVALLGVVGIFVPLFPGIPLVFTGMLIACISGKFGFISNGTVIFLGFLTLLSVLIDYFSGVIGAKYSGASIAGTIGAVLGTVFGVAVLGPIGIILGPALGVLIFELLVKRSIRKTAKSAAYTLISTTVGMILNIIIGVTMIIVFVFSIFI